MIKYVKYNEESGLCTEVASGTNADYYKSHGFVRKDVEQSEIDGQWYLSSKCPHYTDEEKLEKAKTEKLAELTAITSKFDNQLVNTDMVIKSSLGFSINADLRSQLNIHRLINIGTEPVSFVIADNTTADLSLAQLNILISECEENMQYLFGLKQSYKQQIEQAKTKEDLNAIKFEFTMKDFSKVSA